MDVVPVVKLRFCPENIVFPENVVLPIRVVFPEIVVLFTTKFFPIIKLPFTERSVVKSLRVLGDVFGVAIENPCASKFIFSG